MSFTSEVVKMLKKIEIKPTSVILFNIDVLIDDDDYISEPVLVVHKFSKTLRLNHLFYTTKVLTEEALEKTKSKLKVLGNKDDSVYYKKHSEPDEERFVHNITKHMTSLGRDVVMTVSDSIVESTENSGVCVSTWQYHF
jgi:hypothetical protein